MTVDWAMLCDAATVREGLGNILGAGIDTLPSVPRESAPPEMFQNADPKAVGTPVVFTVMIKFSMQRAEANRTHILELKVSDEDGAEVLGTKGQFYIPVNPTLPAGWLQSGMVPITAQILPKKFGGYAVDIFVDDQHLKNLQFRINKATLPNPLPPT